MSAETNLFEGVVPTINTYEMNDANEAFNIEFSELAALAGYIHTRNGQAAAMIELLGVHPDVEGNGLGTRLVESFFAYCVSKEVEVFRCDVTNPAAFTILNKFFDEDNLSISDEINGQEIALPISVPQATMSLERLNAIRNRYPLDNDIYTDFAVVADMSNLILPNPPVLPIVVPYPAPVFNPNLGT